MILVRYIKVRGQIFVHFHASLYPQNVRQRPYLWLGEELNLQKNSLFFSRLQFPKPTQENKSPTSPALWTIPRR